MRKGLLLSALLLLPNAISGQPCLDYTCDSLIVRNILDLNGLDTVKVERAAYPINGRARRIFLGYGYSINSLPKKLTKIPSEIGNLSALEELDIAGNDLGSVPPDIRNCSLLKILRMGGNSLDLIPNFIWHLSNLQELYLENNHISILPDSICLLFSLKLLGLDGNSLKKIPDSIVHVRNLEILSIASNSISSLPDSIVTLDNVKCIFIAGNEMCFLSNSIVNWIKNIRKITFCERGEPVWPESQRCTQASNRFAFSERRLTPVIRILPEKNGIVSCSVRYSCAKTLSLEVFDHAGRLVENPLKSLPQFSGTTIIRLNTKRYRSGAYVLRFTINDTLIETRLLNILR